jgi:hypothetical protein
VKLTSENFDHALKAWSHIINKLDKTDIQAISTAVRTAMAPAYIGDKVRYVGHPNDSGFEFGDIVIVTGVYQNSISARKEGCEIGYYVSNSDYVGYLS